MKNSILSVPLALLAVSTAVGTASALPLPEERAPFIVEFEREAVIPASRAFAGARKSSAGTGADRLDLKTAEVEAYRRELARFREQSLLRASDRIGRILEAEFEFDLTVHAVVLELTATEAVSLRQVPGIRAVNVEEIYSPMTDSGPRWIGAGAIWDGSAVGGIGKRGEGVVVGIIDTGINPD
ncbi:MAG TPA: hypothetical protein VFY12_08260, partial [Arenimonas sp.]|nr:hypothetical protein [Arenimonas sp.]